MPSSRQANLLGLVAVVPRLHSQKDFPEALPGLIWDLGQQLGDLSLESGGLEQESGRSSGFYEDPSSTGGPDSPPSTFCGDSGFSGSGSYGRLGPAEPRGIYASERPKSLGKGPSGCSVGPRMREASEELWLDQSASRRGGEKRLQAGVHGSRYQISRGA
ncbi:dapper homolog 3 [Puma concolor]|uniref:Dapper homolog 3 n=1 Tax=Puma concolor TaxID=9696 RepID=A0A6P6H2U9_PUMCO|nr:dapper homolog 3 [Puma concolor]